MEQSGAVSSALPRTSRVLGQKTAQYRLRAGTYDQPAQRSIAGDTSSGGRLSLPDLLSRWTPVTIEQCLARYTLGSLEIAGDRD